VAQSTSTSVYARQATVQLDYSDDAPAAATRRRAATTRRGAAPDLAGTHRIAGTLPAAVA
jgi:hypothetical protein